MKYLPLISPCKKICRYFFITQLQGPEMKILQVLAYILQVQVKILKVLAKIFQVPL
jgi:hypothetical protein